MASRPLPKDWKQRRARVIARDGGLCQIEGRMCTRRAEAVDHIIPRAQGGGDEMTNLRAVCDVCHEDRRRRPAVPAGWGPQ